MVRTDFPILIRDEIEEKYLDIRIRDSLCRLKITKLQEMVSHPLVEWNEQVPEIGSMRYNGEMVIVMDLRDTENPLDRDEPSVIVAQVSRNGIPSTVGFAVASEAELPRHLL